MLSSKVRIVEAIGFAIALAAGLLLSASPAMASNSKCMDGSGVAGDECTSITGSQNFIDTMQGVFYNGGYITIYDIHIELAGPGGAVIKNCKQVNVLAGEGTPTCQWSPNHIVDLGTYCSYAWKEISSNNYKQVAKACITVEG
jgi:hypothetical protein